MDNMQKELVDSLAAEIGALTIEKQKMAEELEQLRAEVIFLKQRIAEIEQALKPPSDEALH